MSTDHYGVRVLPELYKQWASSGMIANIGGRIVDVGVGRLVLEGNMTEEAHSFPTSRGPIVHGGAIATLADEALATVACLRPAMPGRLIARATVRHRTKRLAFCEATVEHDGGEIVAEARAVIAYVKA